MARIAVGLAVCLFVAIAPTGAVEAAEGTQAEPEKKESGPAAIPTGQIPAEAEKVKTTLAQIAKASARDPKISQIEEELPDFAKALNRRARSDRGLLQDGQRSTLFTIETDWSITSEKLGGWKQALTSRTEKLAGEVGRLSRMRARWEATVRDGSDGSEVLDKRIEATLVDIAASKKGVDDALAPLFFLQDEVAGLQKTTDDVLLAVRESRERDRVDILSIGGPPVWKMDAPDWGGALGAASEEFSQEVSRLRAFLTSSDSGLTGYLLFSFAVMLMFRALARSAERSAEAQPRSERSERDAHDPVRLLEHPIASAYLILAAAAIFYFESAPLLARSIIIVSFVSPMRRLLRIALPQVRWATYSFTLWFAFESIRQNLVPDPSLTRWILLAESVVVGAAFAWLLRPSRLALIAYPTPALRRVGLGIRLVVPVAIAAALANIVGNYELAQVLTDGSLAVLYLALILTVIHLVLLGAWTALLETPRAGYFNAVRRHRDLLRERGGTLIVIVLALGWANTALQAFQLDGVVYGAIEGFLTAKSSVGNLEVSPGDFVALGLVIWLAFATARFICFILDEDILPRASLARGVPFAISTSVRYVIIVIGFMFAVAASGLDTSRFALLVGALGVGIGIGLQDVVNNFVSGLILLFERPIQRGDTVEVGGVMGDVLRIGMRSSTVRTFDGAEVVVPNSHFVSNQFINWTLSDSQRRIVMPVGVAYGTNPEQVVDILTAEAKAHEHILEQPEPITIFIGFGESSLDFEIRAWTQRFDWRRIQSEIGLSIIHKLDAAGITIPFPQRDLHLRSVDPAVGGLARASSSATSSGDPAPG